MLVKQAKSTLIPLGLYWASMIITLLLFILLSRAAVAFHCSASVTHRSSFSFRSQLVALASSSDNNNDDAKVAVKASDLDDAMGLSPDERNVVNVHRVCSPSVVYVTSVLKSMDSSTNSGGSNRRRKQWSRRSRNGAKETPDDDNDKDNNQNLKQKLPRGSALGSGSGFVVDSNGYIVTNYHVIQRAWETNQAVLQYETFWDGLAKNATSRVKDSLARSAISKDSEIMSNMESFINGTVNAISGRESMAITSNSTNLPAQVFVGFGTNGDGDGNNGGGGSSSSSTASYHPCEIVDVVKELDVAVLKLVTPPSQRSSLKALSYGSSSDLLVGQSLLAIGNPFGLDRTITSGLVSALGRSVTGVAGNDIKNCIQTDAAINPGNSGGPLLNLNGEVVGVNTMIITTSGSSAGIGFAVPGDNVKEATDKIVELDKERQLQKAKRKGRGWLGINVATSSLEESLRKRLSGNEKDGAFVTSIAPNSPLLQKDDSRGNTLEITTITNGNIRLGDRIVNVGGTSIVNGDEFVKEMKQRVDGEQLSLTLADRNGDKRVIYVTLKSVPL